MRLPTLAQFKSLFASDRISATGAGIVRAARSTGRAPNRNTRGVLRMYSTHPWMRSALHRVAFDVASVPFELYRAKHKRTPKTLKRAGGEVRRKLVNDGVISGELQRIETHPFLDLLDKPNPAFTAHTTMYLTQLYLDLKGELFWVKERNAIGQPVEVWPVPPHWIAEIPSAQSPFYRAGYMTWNKLFPEDDVLWLKHPGLDNPYDRGSGLGDALADEVDIDEFITGHLKNWFFNGARPDYFLAAAGAAEEEIERLRADLENGHRGPDKSHRPYVTNAADLKLQTIGQTFVEQQLAALRPWQRDIILQTLNIPPEILGILTNSNRSTIDAADFHYAKGVLVPRLEFISSQLQELAAVYGDDLVVTYPSPVAADKEFQLKAMTALPANYSKNEHRALAGMPPVDDTEDEAKGELYQYHLQFQIVTINEARERLGLPPRAGGDVPPDPLLGMGGGMSPVEASAPIGVTKAFAEGQPVDPPWAVRVPRLPSTTKTIGEDAVTSILEALKSDRLADELVPLFNERATKWANRQLEELGAEITFDARNPLIKEHMEKFAGEKIVAINETTREAVRSSLLEGVRAGEGIAQLERRVGDVFDHATKVRARRIARTEVVGASNAANLSAFEQSGLVQGKEWLSVQDSQTRDTHALLNGTIIPINEKFETVNGHKAMAPGGFGIASEDINCRCVVLPVVEIQKTTRRRMTKVADPVARWKAYDRRLTPWENATASAIKRALRKQEADFLAALADLAK